MADEKNATQQEVAEGEQAQADTTSATTTATAPAPKAAGSSSSAERSSSASAATSAPTTPARQGRRARLILTRIDPWSVMKLAFLLSIAAALINVVATVLVWIVLEVLRVFDAINENISQLLSSGTGAGAPDLGAYLTFSRWLGLATLTGVLNVFLITAICTLAAFLYNIATSLVGGVQVTLSD